MKRKFIIWIEELGELLVDVCLILAAIWALAYAAGILTRLLT